MRALSAIALLCLLALPAVANPFPSLYDVTGVAADDVLNVRQQPNANAAIVGHLAPTQRNIEVLDNDGSGKWGLVNTGERSGWVSMRYMHQVNMNADYALAREFHCYGTEPFWSLDVTQGQTATFSSMMEETYTFSAGLVTPGAGRPDRFLLGLGGGAVAVIARNMCDDGMSDREFALEISLITGGQEMALYSGCCSITPK